MIEVEIMSLLDDQLAGLIGSQVAVIMTDGRKFRGKLINHDSKVLILEDVLELSDKLQWVKPIIYTSVAKSITENKDIVEQSERGYLDTVLINTRHIIRIWPWNPKKIEQD
jgi:small nuclear ribonucleoprotein (snRNP)-like protein